MPVEAIIDPARPIVDAHHHLYDRPDLRYLAKDYAADLASGHNITRTVYVQARHAYDASAPEALRPIGETVFARSVANDAAAGTEGEAAIADAIIPFADLMLGDAALPVLEAHIAAGDGRVRGIRHILAWHADARLLNPGYPSTEAMMESAAFRAGFAHLGPLGLRFDAWVYFPQLARLAHLADAFPDTRIVVDHCGGPVRVGGTDGVDANYSSWRAGMAALAERPNVAVKLSGLGMPVIGLGFDTAGKRPSSGELAMAWRPWMETCIDLFGARRAMFASNFPADRPSYDYAVGWNAMKLVAAGASASEKDWLFAGAAADFYGLPDDIGKGAQD